MAGSLPACVARIRPDRLELAGDAGGLRRSLARSARAGRLGRNERLQLCIGYDPADGAIHRNRDLHELLRWLIGHDVPFMERYGEMDSPAELLRMLHAEGCVGPFRSIVVRAADDWELFRHPPVAHRGSR